MECQPVSITDGKINRIVTNELWRLKPKGPSLQGPVRREKRTCAEQPRCKTRQREPTVVLQLYCAAINRGCPEEQIPAND